MKTHLLLAGLAALATAGFASADVIAPVSVTGTVAGDAGSSIANLGNGSGLSAALATGASDASALAATHTRTPTGHVDSWTFGTGGGNPIFTFDLTGGGDTTVGSIILWQYGNNGGGGTNTGNDTRGFSLDFRTDAEGTGGAFAADFSGTMDTLFDSDTPDNVAQAFGFGALADIRYVLLQIDTNYGGEPGVTGGGDRYGLGEVRFSDNIIPEPGSLALLGLGGLAMMRRRRG